MAVFGNLLLYWEKHQYEGLGRIAAGAQGKRPSFFSLIHEKSDIKQ